MTGDVRTTRKKRVDPKLLAALRLSMLILSGLILILGLVLLILPMIRVTEIEVKGNSYYSAEQIIQASGIQVGDELLAIDYDAAINQLTGMKYVSRVNITSRFGTLCIEVTERATPMVAELYGRYYTFDRTLTVLEASDDPEAFASFIKVTLPEVLWVEIGEPILFAAGVGDLTYLEELFVSLEKKGCVSEVTEIDISHPYAVSFTLSNACRIKVGKVRDMELKLHLADTILASREAPAVGMAVVDVSSTEKPTYRELAEPTVTPAAS